MTEDLTLSDLRHSTGPLLVKPQDGTLYVTLNRPEVANALDPALMTALTELWTHAARVRDLRCVVLTGAGSGFCSGADATMLAGTRTSLGDSATEEMSFLPGPHVSVPVIVLVNGVCAGGGLHFVADADICIASSTARFVDPHVSVGQVSALEPLLLRTRIRPDALMRMALLGRGEALDARRAEEVALVSEVVEPDRLGERGRELAGAVAEASPEAVRLTRRVLRTFEERLLQTHLDLGWELIRRHRDHPDATEGPRAFIEKRQPRWEADLRP